MCEKRSDPGSFYFLKVDPGPCLNKFGLGSLYQNMFSFGSEFETRVADTEPDTYLKRNRIGIGFIE